MDFIKDETTNRSLVLKKAKKSVSSTAINTECNFVPLRDTKSFTGVITELKQEKQIQTFREDGQITDLESRIKYIMCRTTDVFANKDYIIEDVLLNYKGKQYASNDVARLWKKDFRTWLWKNKSKQKFPLTDKSN